ncbi:hypothetical protein E2C01_078336 [Portunus trituberculatus]|uniref:Uncharacterized protein n=1 Tax=Portunus trituberculatus TaxID=210409 RepID=A0A5B7IIH0_PORTR|nr:hypothetical protein [Portunus trituberculatus]
MRPQDITGVLPKPSRDVMRVVGNVILYPTRESYYGVVSYSAYRRVF